MRIHKTGYRIIIIIAALVLGINIIAIIVLQHALAQEIIALLSFTLFIFVLRFFRVPSREIAYQKGNIRSPADGKVVTIEEVFEDELLQQKALQISIFMSVWNVHINWFPCNGELISYKYHPGKFLIAHNPKSSAHNERTSVLLKNDQNQAILVRQIAGIVARRIENYFQESHTKISAGQQMGFIKFGSRVDLFLPLNAKINVQLGQQVRGQESLIAELPG